MVFLLSVLLIGANQKIMRCRVFVVSEQITPSTQSKTIAKRTVSTAVLCDCKSLNLPIGHEQTQATHGEYLYTPLPTSPEFILAAANNI